MVYTGPFWSRLPAVDGWKLRSKCVNIATDTLCGFSNGRIREELDIPFFADHIRAPTESFNSKLGDATSRFLRDWPKGPLVIKATDSSTHTPFGFTDWGFPWFVSVTGNAKLYLTLGHGPLPPIGVDWINPALVKKVKDLRIPSKTGSLSTTGN
jgi:hypothetical protein